MIPYVAISQPRYLPAINYLQRIYHSDKFIVLDDCQHQRRAFEHRNKVIKLPNCSQRESQWLSLTIDKSAGSRPLIMDIKLSSLEKNLLEHSHVIKNVYGLNSAADHAFTATCVDIVLQKRSTDSFVDFCVTQIYEIFRFLDINLSSKILLSSGIPGTSSGSSRIMECCLGVAAKAYVSGPNGRDYLSLNEFRSHDIEILYHDFLFPEYPQVGSGNFLPWMAWIDMVHGMGKEAVKDFILEPLSLSRS